MKERELEVVKLYKQGVTMEQISKELHISKYSIREIVKAHNVYIPKRFRFLNGPNPEEKIAEFYAQQEKIEEVKEPSKPISEKVEKYKHSLSSRDVIDKLKGAIHTEDIRRLQKQTKVGSRLYIKTDKAINVDVEANRGFHPPLIRKATVISTKSPVFCIVQIDGTNVTESVRWADILIARRKGKKYV